MHSVINIHVFTSIADKHSTMLNMTARLAIEMRYLPQWEVEWDDETPQRDPVTLTISDLLPGDIDGRVLQKRAVLHIMSILIEFPSLSYLSSLMPAEEHINVKRSNVVLMKILFKDEKYKAETIDILGQLVCDAELSGKPEVCKLQTQLK